MMLFCNHIQIIIIIYDVPKEFFIFEILSHISQTFLAHLVYPKFTNNVDIDISSYLFTFMDIIFLSL